MVRICPRTDVECPFKAECPYWFDSYDCEYQPEKKPITKEASGK